MSWLRDNTLSLLQRWCIKVVKCGEIPRHVAFIMDGNRRYAQREHVEKIEGHTKGFDKLAETLTWCRDLGIEEVTVYAFSIENFKRAPEEVDALMELARQKFQRLLDEKDKLMEHGLRVRVIGKLQLLPADIRKLILDVMKLTENNTKAFLNVAFSYTGREEISQAISAVVSGVKAGEIAAEDVTEDLLSRCLYTHPSPHPELLIRTSGEVRLSDFLLWQSWASCVYFTQNLWPEFSLWNMLSAVLLYQRTHSALLNLRSTPHASLQASSQASSTDRFVEGVAAARQLAWA